MKIKDNMIDRVLDILCLIIIVGTFLFLIIRWSKLGDQVPMHYDFAGEIDRMGSKGEILITPIMMAVLAVGLTVLEHFPKLWNTGVTVTPQNAPKVYRTLKYLLKSLKIILVVDFSALTIFTIIGKNLPSWFTLALILVIFWDLVFWIVRLFMVRK